MTLGGYLANAKVAAALAREQSAVPVVHENGFIQLPLGPLARLHVWPDGPVVRQKTRSPIHDHRFALESIVLAGQLTHVEYEWWQDKTKPTHQVFEVEDGRLVGKPETGFLKVRGVFIMPAGAVYTFNSRHFHESMADGLTATIMRKTKNYPEYVPRVLCPLGQDPDNDFKRDAANPPERLWEYIDRALSGV